MAVSSNDELGRLAQDFNRLASSLEKNESMRRAFMADISHELRTPLAILRGELEAMQDGVRKLTPEAVSSLLMEVATLTKLVDDLHQLSLSDEGALAYRKAQPTRRRCWSWSRQLPRALRQSRADAAAGAAGAGALFGDPDRLIQLFTNLLENSLRYTDRDGTVSLALHATASGWRLLIDDSAPGVADAQREKIFERFWRSEGSRNRASGGSGLGLAICRNIVEAHGGAMSADHSDLGGLQIRVELPHDKL